MSWFKNPFHYDGWLSRLKTSPNAKLQKHFFLGTSFWTGEPILFSDDILGEHMLVTGNSGSGKSARVLAPLLSQVIERRDRSVVFIDQKGDRASFFNCFDAAFRAGLPFKYFTVVPGDESFIFNPLRQKVHGRITPMQQAELLIQASGTDYGEIYGGAFFQGNSELAVCNYFTHYATPPLEQYSDLFKLFNDKFSYANIGQIDDWINAGQLRPILARAASISPLNASPKNLDKASAHANAIEMTDLLRAPGVYYFNLPASLGRSSCRFIARTLLQELFVSAGLRRPDESVSVLAVCDEFQELVGPSIDVFLEQCRSRGISCVLSHQSIGQLERNGGNLLTVVQACVSTHIVVDAVDVETVEYVQKRSGQAYFALASWSQPAPVAEVDWFGANVLCPWKAASADGINTPMIGAREEIGYRMDQNFIRRASARPLMAFIAIKKNSGFANFDGLMIPMRAYFHIDRDLFEKRSKEPWPKWDRPETVIVKMSSPFEVPPASGKKAAAENVQTVRPPETSDEALRERLRPKGGSPKRPGQS